MSLPPVFLSPTPPEEEDPRAKRQRLGVGPRYFVHVRHERHVDDYLAPDAVTRTPESYGNIRVQVTRLPEDAPRPVGMQKVKPWRVREMFRAWWQDMADRIPRTTPFAALSFDFDKTWWLRLPPGATPPWEGTFDDRDWELDPEETRKTIEARIVEVMGGIQPVPDPPAYFHVSAHDGNAQEVDDDWLYGTPEHSQGIASQGP